MQEDGQNAGDGLRLEGGKVSHYFQRLTDGDGCG
jgi:hypothetical protein